MQEFFCWLTKEWKEGAPKINLMLVRNKMPQAWTVISDFLFSFSFCFLTIQKKHARVTELQSRLGKQNLLRLSFSGGSRGLHGNEAFTDLRDEQQFVLTTAAAAGCRLSRPDLWISLYSQIPNEHAGQGTNEHGYDAVSSTTGILAFVIKKIIIKWNGFFQNAFIWRFILVQWSSVDLDGPQWTSVSMQKCTKTQHCCPQMG